MQSLTCHWAGQPRINQCITANCLHSSRPEGCPPVTPCSGQAAPCPKRGQQLFGQNSQQNGSMNKTTAGGHGKVGWWTAQCVCQEGLDPPSHGVTVSRAELILQCWRQQWLHHWDLWDRDSAGTQLHSAQAHGAKTASYPFSNSPQINRKQLATIYLFSFFFNYQDCCNDFHFEMSQMYKKNAVIYFFLCFRDLTVLNVNSKILSGLWEMELALLWVPHDAERGQAYFRSLKKGKMISNISTDFMS